MNLNCKSLVRNYQNELRSFCKRQPSIFYPIARMKPSNGRNLVNKDTHIVIEGFPRSANTFSVNAFKYAQQRPCNIAHHFHAAAQILLAVRWGIPAITLIRDPREAITSIYVYDSSYSIKSYLRSYISFYTTLVPYKHAFITAPFHEVINDFGAIIVRVNRKYDTRFTPFVSSKENVSKIFAMVDDDALKAKQGPLRLARPHDLRNKLKDEAAKQLSIPKLKNLLEDATILYHDFTAK